MSDERETTFEGYSSAAHALATFDSYSGVAHETAQYPEPEKFHYASIGLANEAGEFLGKLKHLWRDRGICEWEKIPPAAKDKLIAELGDILWYLNEVAIHLGSSLGEVASRNYAKLADRQARGTILGEGDDR